jgi:thymidylate kinase
VKNRTSRLLICIIGVDGSGKTTCAINLKEQLKNKGFDCLYTHHSSPMINLIKSVAGDRIRKYVSPMQNGGVSPLKTSTGSVGKRLKTIIGFFIVFADTIIERLMKIRFSLRQPIVIHDRYFYDHLVNYLGELPEWLAKLYLRLIPKPDLTILLDVPETVAYRRKGEASLRFIRRQRHLYLNLEKWLNMNNFVTINTNTTIEEVNDSISYLVSNLVEGRNI